jgi:foldase protein PrsA
MRASTNSRTILILLNLSACLFLYGCAASADSGTTSARNRTFAAPAASPLSRSPLQNVEPAATVIDARPAALVNGRPVTWGELRPTLNELAGADALAEFILDRKLQEALVIANVTIAPEDAVGERKMLLESLSDDPNVAIRLLEDLRGRQKMGKVRFEALLRRNAGLRALVRDRVQITEQAVQTMHEMLHGPKRQARLMILPDLQTAEAAINLVKSGVSFGDVAVEMSTDSSASRGGLLEPISRADPAFPESVRQTLWTLNTGEMSGPVLIDKGYAVLMLVKRVGGDGAKLDEARPTLERLVRLNQERLLMDQLARQLISDTQVTVFDDSLHESWARQKHRAK